MSLLFSHQHAEKINRDLVCMLSQEETLLSELKESNDVLWEKIIKENVNDADIIKQIEARNVLEHKVSEIDEGIANILVEYGSDLKSKIEPETKRMAERVSEKAQTISQFFQELIQLIHEKQKYTKKQIGELKNGNKLVDTYVKNTYLPITNSRLKCNG